MEGEGWRQPRPMIEMPKSPVDVKAVARSLQQHVEDAIESYGFADGDVEMRKMFEELVVEELRKQIPDAFEADTRVETEVQFVKRRQADDDPDFDVMRYVITSRIGTPEQRGRNTALTVRGTYEYLAMGEDPDIKDIVVQWETPRNVV